jgi:hypothetical protein
MTICMPAKMETSIARTRAEVGRSMRTAGGRIRVRNQLPTPRMWLGHRELRHSSLVLKALAIDPLLHNNQPSLQGQSNNLTETLRPDRQERSEQGNTNSREAGDGRVENARGVLAELDVDLSDPGRLFQLNLRRSPKIRRPERSWWVQVPLGHQRSGLATQGQKL